MKYIRTKAGEIYDIDDLYVCEELNGKPYGVKKSGWVIYKESITKQADTIEELCDNFIILCPPDENPDFLINFKKEEREKYFDLSIYGCVWIILPNKAPRLEPVAKMNNKGELELL